MAILERNEWCEFWWEDADKKNSPRALFIGDSITKGYRPYVNECIKEKVCIDMLATSKALDNPSLLLEIDYILSHGNFKYEVIHFNNGLHGWHMSEEEYEKWLDVVVLHLREVAKDANLILAFTTPVTKAGNPEELDGEINSRVIARNASIRRIAVKYDCIINDLYTPMISKSEFRYEDGYHYIESGYKMQAEITVRLINRFF
jgi:lysophospholipase L1-like esterase